MVIHLEASSQAFRLLVTGSRTWLDRVTLEQELDRVLFDVLFDVRDRGLIVVHGDAPRGADRMTRNWAQTRIVEGRPVREERHPAAWRRADGTKDPLAGFARNQEMVDAGAALCVTFIDECPCPRRGHPHGSHGSVDCATRAAATRIPVRHVRTARGGDLNLPTRVM
jgi:hypothetical protein